MREFATLGPIALALYAALLAAGGLVGYVKAGSRPSLIAGLISAALAAVCLAVAEFVRRDLGLGAGLALALALLALFTRRFSRTRKFMPGGLLALVSLVVIVLLAAALVRGDPS